MLLLLWQKTNWDFLDSTHKPSLLPWLQKKQGWDQDRIDFISQNFANNISDKPFFPIQLLKLNESQQDDLLI